MPKGNVNEAAEFIRVVWQTDRGEFGEYLRQRRQKLGYSQIEMARRIGVHQSQISRIENAETTPQSYQIALAFAQCYQLNKQETEEWLQLFGMSKYQAVDLEYGHWLVSVESLVQQIWKLFQINPRIDTYDYFAPLTHSLNYFQLDSSWEELRSAIDLLINEKVGIYGDYLLVEFGSSVIHYLDARGDYSRRLALSRNAARAAEKLERKTVLGWLFGDTIPYTLIEQFNDPHNARIYLEKGREVAREIQHDELLSLIDAYTAWADLLIGNSSEAMSKIRQLQALNCAPVIQGRIHRIAGDIAFGSGEYREALSCYNQAVASVNTSGTRPGVTELRLAKCYLALNEVSHAAEVFSDVLLKLQQIGSPPYESCLAKLGLTRIAHIQGARAEAKLLASEAEGLLQCLQIPCRAKSAVRNYYVNFS